MDKQFDKSKSKNRSIIFSAIGTILGIVIFTILPSSTAIMILAGAITGFLVGLLPYFVAKKKNNLNLAKIALISCTIAGGFLGILLAGPVAIVFTVVVILQNRQKQNKEPLL